MTAVMKMKKGLIIVVLLIPILLVVWFYLHVSMHSQDIDPIDASDLLWVRPDIPASNNAYHIFTNAVHLLCLSDENEYEMSEYLWDTEPSEESKGLSQEQIASLIESNKLFLVSMSEGVQRDHYIVENPKEPALSIMELLKMNTMLLAKVKFLMDAGKVNEALDTAMVSLRLGELQERDAQNILDAKVGLVIISRALFFIDKITDCGPVTPDRAERLLTQLHKLKKLRTGLENGYKAHYSFLVDETIDSRDSLYTSPAILVAEKLIRRDYVFKPNATKKVLSEYWRDQIDRLKNPEKKIWDHLDMSEYRKPEGWIEEISFALVENSRGKRVLEICTWSGDTVSENAAAYKTEEEVSALEKKLLLRQQKKGGL